MIRVMSLAALGDNLILLSLLERLPAERRYELVGSELTRSVSGLLRRPLSVTVVLPGKAAFLDVRQRGLLAAWNEGWRLRRELSCRWPAGEVLLFDRGGLRPRLVTPSHHRVLLAPSGDSAYQDLRQAVSLAFSVCLDWPDAPRLNRPVRQLLINPCAGERRRWLSADVVALLLEIAADRAWKVTVLDPADAWAGVESFHVCRLSRPTLQQAREELMGADLYIGPDSFFLHLAYYFGVPALGTFHPGNLRFLPPGSDRRWVSFDQADRPMTWISALKAIGAE